MKVGVPKEIKNHEDRVAITPTGVHELVAPKHEVVIERDADIGSQISNEAYLGDAGMTIAGSADDASAPKAASTSCLGS